MRMLLLAFTLILAAAVNADAPPQGALCVANAVECQETIGATADVAATATARTFVWRRGKGAEVAVGSIPPNATRVTWPERSVALRIKDQGPTDAPERITLTIAGPEQRWELALHPREAASLARLFLPEGNHTLTAAAAHRIEARVQVTAARLAYDVVLLPRPAIGGRVVDKRTRKGVVGAVITALPAETTVALTDFSGQFSFEPEEEWPKALRVSAPGLGAKTIAAPASRTPSTLPWVELSPAGAIALTIRHDADVEAELLRIQEDAESTPITSKVVRRDAATIRFDDLDEGDYELRLKGQGPFERYTTTIAVKPEETTAETIELAPVPLDIHVVRDTTGIPGVSVAVTHLDPEWKTEATTDENGHVKGPLWQQGLFVAFVSPPQGGGTQIARKSLSGINDLEWRISLQGGTVAGTIVDARDKFPIARAKVRLETTKASGMQELTAVSDANGEFRFSYVPEGRQALTAHTTGYLVAEETFELTPSVPERRLRVELVPADAQRVRVVSSYGAPLVGATIADESGGLHSVWVTDADGYASIPVRGGQSKTLFVLPREGSFAVATLKLPASGEEVTAQQIVVPRGEVTIDIRTQDGSGNGVPDVELFLRHNGTLIPEAVARLMFKLQGNMLRTGKNGAGQLRNLPVGSYEFWPYFSLAELQHLTRGPQVPGTSLIATPGTNSIVLTFERRGK